MLGGIRGADVVMKDMWMEELRSHVFCPPCAAKTLAVQAKHIRRARRLSCQASRESLVY